MPCGAEIGLNILVFLLDDMRADELDVLTRANDRLAEHAVVFERAYVTIPMCCPERASFLSGGFLPQYVGVLTNNAPRGGATLFPDDDTLAVRLQESGYATALYGKYLNEYARLGPYVPPGWTDWAAVTEDDGWFTFTPTTGSSTPHAPGAAVDQTVYDYVTDWQSELGANFLQTHANEPRFLYQSFVAPHEPHDPAPEDVGAFAGAAYRGGAWQEADMSDKPAWIADEPLLTDEQVAELDAEYEERLETLLSVDRGIEQVLTTVESLGVAENTVVFITSDNGVLLGEHRLVGKGVAYEPSVRVPLLAWSPSFSPRRTDALVAANLDLAATVTDLAGLPPRGDGQTLRPLLCGDTEVHRNEVLLQTWSDAPAWSGLVTPTWKYVETGTGERELYDLSADPDEATSVVAAHSDVAAALAERLAPLRGLQITSTELPDARLGVPYATDLQAWGGQGDRTWTLLDGVPPAGLTLRADGRLAGRPLRTGSASFTVSVVDGTVSPVHGGPQRDEQTVTLAVRMSDDAPQAHADTGTDTDSGGGEQPAPLEPAPCGCGGGAGAAALVVTALVPIRRRARAQHSRR